MLPCCQKSLQDEQLEIAEHVRFLATHYIHKLLCQFERGSLEAQVPWRRRQNETKVDVNQMARVVQQNIAVVSAKSQM